MGILGKKEPDIDYTLLQKKGILKKAEEKKLPFKFDKSGMVDLTQVNANASVNNNDITTSLSASGDIFGALDNLANANSQANPLPANLNDINSIKVKIDDLEYKLDRFMEKIQVIESKLKNFERKIKF